MLTDTNEEEEEEEENKIEMASLLSIYPLRTRFASILYPDVRPVPISSGAEQRGGGGARGASQVGTLTGAAMSLRNVFLLHQ